MNLTTKFDLVNAALRKIAVASNATLTDTEPQSFDDGVSELEMMVAEWLQDGSGIDVGYLFAADGDPVDGGDPHGLKTSSLSAVISNLACRIAPDYALEAMAKVVINAANGKERLVKLGAQTRAIEARQGVNGYPSRMPVGSGNRLLTRNGINFFPGVK